MHTAIRLSADVTASGAAGLKPLQFVFFAPGNDASVWLDGWHPDVLAAQRAAGDRTRRAFDYSAGRAPVLYLQPSRDPLARLDETEE